MARSRNIKPGFFLNDELAQLEMAARLLFAGLWTIADREGRLEDRPLRIKAEVLPYDSCNVDDLLTQLHDAGFIKRYKHDTKNYIQIINFTKHQNPHKNEATSTIPAPDTSDTSSVQESECPENDSPQKADIMGVSDDSGTSTVQAPYKHNTNPADSLNLIPDSLNQTTITLTPIRDEQDGFDPEELESRSRQVLEKYEVGFGRTLNEIEAGKILFWLENHSPELIVHALEIAVLGNNRSCQYIGGILNNWRNKGVKCVQDVEELEKKRQQKKKQTTGYTKDRASPPVETMEFYTPPEVLEELRRESG